MGLSAGFIRLIGAAAIFGITTTTNANLVNNGSFESPDVLSQSSGLDLYLTGSTAITGWTVVGPTASDSIQLVPDTFLGLQASDGHQWVDLTGDVGYNKGLISDAIATSVGTTYHLSFDVGNYLPDGVSTVGLQINGGPETLFTNDSLAATSTSPMNWAAFGVNWIADSPDTRLTFIGLANGAMSNDNVIGLDDIALTPAVPEPSSWAIMFAGMCTFGFLGFRRRATSPTTP
jgi:hypothetical protein